MKIAPKGRRRTKLVKTGRKEEKKNWEKKKRRKIKKRTYLYGYIPTAKIEITPKGRREKEESKVKKRKKEEKKRNKLT